jgi:hypothetical protein
MQDSLAFLVGDLSRVDYLRKRGFNTEMIELARREIPNDAAVILHRVAGYYTTFGT